jgi:hypothetical protein
VTVTALASGTTAKSSGVIVVLSAVRVALVPLGAARTGLPLQT